MDTRLLLARSFAGIACFLASTTPAAAARPISAPPGVVIQPQAPQHDAGCVEVYANATEGQIYAVFGAGVEALDDLHTTLDVDGALCAFDFEYHKTDADVPTDVTVTFYENTPDDDVPGAVVAGPFEFLGLLGTATVHHEADAGTVGPDVWVGIEASTGDFALHTMRDPTIGSSHDLFYIRPPGSYNDMAGFTANLYVRLFVGPAVPTLPATWGSLKATYR